MASDLQLPPGVDWRPSQREYAEHVLACLRSGGVHGVEAPTGSGKSIGFLAAALAWGEYVTVVSHSRTHCHQLSETAKRWPGSDVAMLFGHAYYCRGTDWPCECGATVEREQEECPDCHARAPECTRDGCPYRKALERAKNAKVAILTLAGYQLRIDLLVEHPDAHADLRAPETFAAVRSLVQAEAERFERRPDASKLLATDRKVLPLALRRVVSAYRRVYSARRLLASSDPNVAIALERPDRLRSCRVKFGSPDVRDLLPSTAILTSATLPSLNLPYDSHRAFSQVLPSPKFIEAPNAPHKSSGDEYLDFMAGVVRSAADSPDRGQRRVLYLAMSRADAQAVADRAGIPGAIVEGRGAHRNAEDVRRAALADPCAVVFGDSGLMAGLDLPGGMALIVHAATQFAPSLETECDRITEGAETVWDTDAVRDGQWALARQAFGRAVRCPTDVSVAITTGDGPGNWRKIRPVRVV